MQPPAPLLPGSRIGIIGGGQLGRMTAIAAAHMGYRVTVLDPDPDCPAAQVADDHIVSPYEDRESQPGSLATGRTWSPMSSKT